MGKVLQIRVSAWTYNEDDVARSWKKLCGLVWSESLRPGEKRGVLELVTALENGLAFGDWPAASAESLKDGIAEAVAVKLSLEEALAEWDPRLANKRSDELEDILTRLEDKAPLI